MTQIKFGTSGWRGILAEDFTLENVRIVTQAIADLIRDKQMLDRGVVIGHDSRFMGEKFARESARILAGSKIKAYVCDRDTPTPVIAYEVLRRGCAAAINFTASHNPPDYNGLKYSPESGGPALPEETRDIERRANEMLGEVCYREMPLDQAVRCGLVEVIDPRKGFLEALKEHVDLESIRKGGLSVIVNPMFGAGRDYLDTILSEAGVSVQSINNHRDPYFGGLPPDPSQNYLNDLISRVKDDPKINLGLATDGDADRYGIVDADGTFIEPNYILALLLDYLIRVKGQSGAVARSVATSHLVDAVAGFHGVEVLETPVGFKYIGEYISEGRILIGGEESAGLTVRGHVPDKDGILACLLVAEMVAVEGKSVSELLTALYVRVGEFRTTRRNIHLTPDLVASFDAKLARLPSHLAGKGVDKVITIDGTKLVLNDGSWVLFRKSGTEPVVRVYAEAGSEEALKELADAAVDFIHG